MSRDLIPHRRQIRSAIGVEPLRTEISRQMDGTLIEREVGRALLRIAGKEEVVPVVFGEREDAAVVGVLALEALALGLDPTSGRLRPVTLRQARTSAIRFDSSKRPA
jgi:predicted aspartyl protease